MFLLHNGKARQLIYLKSVLILVLLLPLSSCVTVQERISILKNGSGHYAVEIDFLQSSDLVEQAIAAFAQSAGSGAGTPVENLRNILQNGAAALNNIKGITQAKAKVDMERYICGISFDFADLTALNIVFAQLNQATANYQSRPAFELKGKTLQVNNFYNAGFLADALLPNFNGDTTFIQLKSSIFEAAMYSCSIEIEGKIKKYEHRQAMLNSNSTQIYLLVPLKDIVEARVATYTELKFR